MRPSSSRLLVAAVVVAAAIIGLAAFALTGDDRPLDRVSLIGTVWQVTSIDGSPTLPDQRPTLRFDAGNKAVLETPCRVISLGFSADTDGAAISFGENEVVERGCTATEAAPDETLRAALADTNGWRVKTTESIELFAAGGRTVVGLNRTNAPNV